MARAARMARPKRIPQKVLAMIWEAIFKVAAGGALGSSMPMVLKRMAWSIKAAMPTGRAAFTRELLRATSWSSFSWSLRLRIIQYSSMAPAETA